MGDSEDDFERRGRDRHDRNKFRGERKGESYPRRYDDRRRGSDRSESKSQSSSKGLDYQEYLKKNKRYHETEKDSSQSHSREIRSPPPKRTRSKQWNDEPRDTRPTVSSQAPPAERHRGPNVYVNPNFMYPNPAFCHQPMPPQQLPYHNLFAPRPGMSRHANPDTSGGKGLMSFKSFLLKQDDEISDDDARAKYRKYKQEYEQAELQDFFKEHKDEEWFQQKYHPDEVVKIQNEKTDAVKTRLKIFMDYYKADGLEGVSLDASEGDSQLSFLEKMGILLEGGTVQDFHLLDVPQPHEQPNTTGAGPSVAATAEETIVKQEELNAANVKIEKAQDEEIKEEAVDLIASAEDMDVVTEDECPSEGNVDVNKVIENIVITSSVGCCDIPLDTASTSQGMEPASSPSFTRSRGDSVSEIEDVDEVEPLPPGIDCTSPHTADAKDELADTMLLTATEDDVAMVKDNVASEEPPVADSGTTTPGGEPEKPPPTTGFHRLGSLFIRSLPPSVTKQEVEAMCSKFPGFLRVAMADPTPERRFFRRAWITFSSCDHLKETIVQMNNIKLRNCNLGVIVNRSLVKRVRPSLSGVTSDLQVVKHDIKLAAQLAYSQDCKHGLWQQKEGEEGEGEAGADLKPLVLRMVTSKNPFLANILDYITEEAPAEEDAYVGGLSALEGGEDGQLMDCDGSANFTQFLDRLLLYLRVVHSIDYYNCCEYINEHQMPNRCGILYVRGPPVTEAEVLSRDEVTAYCEENELKVAKTFLKPPETVVEADLVQLGVKDKETEIEKYIESNMMKLTKDKWLCHISGKKFSTPAYVRKHIFNKHAQKLEDVKKNVEFYNNYLRDAKRPKPVDPAVMAANDMAKRRDSMPVWPGRGINNRGFRHGPPMPHQHVFYHTPFMFPPGFRGGFNRGRGVGGFPDPNGRAITNYRDLDSPTNDGEDLF